jgi:hypothetical protein
LSVTHRITKFHYTRPLGEQEHVSLRLNFYRLCLFIYAYFQSIIWDTKLLFFYSITLSCHVHLHGRNFIFVFIFKTPSDLLQLRISESVDLVDNWTIITISYFIMCLICKETNLWQEISLSTFKLKFLIFTGVQCKAYDLAK